MKKSFLIFLALVIFGSLVLAQNTMFWRADESKKEIYLTFDDGPDWSTTPEIIKLLKRSNIKATFFLIGKNVKVNPSLVRWLAQEGHAIGNHTYSHSKYYRISDQKAFDEIKKTNDLIVAASGFKPRSFRPPFGIFNCRFAKAADKNGLEIVFWDIDPGDIKVSPQQMTERIVSRIRNGSIILCHSSDILRPSFKKALPEIIKQAQAKGFPFKTL